MRTVMAGTAVVLSTLLVFAAGPQLRKPLGASERAAVLALMKAADAAQGSDASGADAIGFEHAVLKSTNGNIYVPFRVVLNGALSGVRSGALYVRAVTRKDGAPRSGEQSALRLWVENPTQKNGQSLQPMVFSPGEMPVGGPASTSIRQATQAAAASLTTLELQQRAYETQKAQIETARPIFPFEDYYFFDFKNAREGDRRVVERALALPPGEYDLHVGIVDRAQKGAAPALRRQIVTIPDFWDDRLALSTLMLARDVRTLTAPLAPQAQVEHPFTFGHAEVIPVSATTFTADEALTVVFQMCNYGAPDADLRAEYSFFRTGDGPRRLFNRTDPQVFSDADLPPPNPWTTQAFAMQTVSLKTFPAGQYELEVTVSDRLTRASARGTVAFTVGVR